MFYAVCLMIRPCHKIDILKHFTVRISTTCNLILPSPKYNTERARYNPSFQQFRGPQLPHTVLKIYVQEAQAISKLLNKGRQKNI
jgi:hypothetical protein